MDREAWSAAIHGVAKSRTRLSNWPELNGNRRAGWWMGTGLRVRFSNTPSHKISSIIVIEIKVCCAKLFQSCPTLCDPMDCSPPGSTIHAILQARILEWVAMPSSRGSSWPREQSCVASLLYYLCYYQGSPNQSVVLFKTWENFGVCEYFFFIYFQHLSKPCTLPPFKKKKGLANTSQVIGLGQNHWPLGGQTLDGKVHSAGKGFSEEHLLQQVSEDERSQAFNFTGSFNFYKYSLPIKSMNFHFFAAHAFKPHSDVYHPVFFTPWHSPHFCFNK